MTSYDPETWGRMDTPWPVRSPDAALLDRLHTAEAKVAILESQVARQTADIDDAVDRFKHLGEQLALQGAELFALRSFKASVPWDDLYSIIYWSQRTAYDERIIEIAYTIEQWLDANHPQEAAE